MSCLSSANFFPWIFNLASWSKQIVTPALIDDTRPTFIIDLCSLWFLLQVINDIQIVWYIMHHTCVLWLDLGFISSRFLPIEVVTNLLSTVCSFACLLWSSYLCVSCWNYSALCLNHWFSQICNLTWNEKSH